MPALRVSVDGRDVAVIDTAAYSLLAVNLHGGASQEAYAVLDVGGGAFPPGGESAYLTWVANQELRAGQTVTVALEAEGVSSHPGKTFAELFPDEPPGADKNFVRPTPDDAMWAEIAARPRLRDGYTVRFTSSTGGDCLLRTRPEEDSFGFNVLWHGEAMFAELGTRVSLGTSCLEQVRKQEGGPQHVLETLQVGGSVTLELVE
jgi:hypothetical protein